MNNGVLRSIGDLVVGSEVQGQWVGSGQRGTKGRIFDGERAMEVVGRVLVGIGMRGARVWEEVEKVRQRNMMRFGVVTNL